MICMGNKLFRTFFVVALVIFVIFPYIASGFWIRLLTSIFLFAVLAEAVNIIMGFTGYMAFGNMIFFGLGAYTTGVLMTKAGISFLPSIVASGIIGILVAILIGIPLLRLKGHYFALASLGAAEATRQIMDNLTGLTRGAMGLTFPQMAKTPAEINTYFYYMMFVLLLIVLGTAYYISKSRLGYALKAIGANEEAADVMGINTTFYKIVAWSISGLFMAIAGAIYGYWFAFIQPETVFDLAIIVDVFVILLLGGTGTVMGPVYGAFILGGISEIVWSRFLNLHLGILGTLMILIVFFIPNGLIDMMRKGFSLKAILNTINENKI
jgi:branched-chain amino acid transport system permease protein